MNDDLLANNNDSAVINFHSNVVVVVARIIMIAAAAFGAAATTEEPPPACWNSSSDGGGCCFHHHHIIRALVSWPWSTTMWFVKWSSNLIWVRLGLIASLLPIVRPQLSALHNTNTIKSTTPLGTNNFYGTAPPRPGNQTNTQTKTKTTEKRGSE